MTSEAGSEPDFGALMGGAWKLLAANSAPLLKTWAAAALPATALGLLASSWIGIDGKEQALDAWKAGRVAELWIWLLAMLGARLAEALALAAVVVAADEALEGRPCDPGAAWRRLGSRLSALLSTGVVYLARVLAGYALLIVPGVILSIRWTLWSFAVLIEGRSGSDALARSRQIVKANLVTVLCAAWGSAALAAAVEYFSAMLCAILPYLLALAMALATGIGVEEASLPFIILFGLLNLLAGAAAASWSKLVVLLTWRALAPRHPEPPERGYLV